RQLVELTARLGEAASEQVLRLRKKLLWVGCQGGNGERMDQVKLGTRLGAGQIFRRFERFERGAREIDAHQDHRAGPSAAIVGSRHVASLSYAESAFAVPARYQRPTYDPRSSLAAALDLKHAPRGKWARDPPSTVV